MTEAELEVLQDYLVASQKLRRELSDMEDNGYASNEKILSHLDIMRRHRERRLDDIIEILLQDAIDRKADLCLPSTS